VSSSVGSRLLAVDLLRACKMMSTCTTKQKNGTTVSIRRRSGITTTHCYGHAPHLSAGSTVDRSGRPRDGGPVSLSSSQILTSFLLALEVISGFASNAAAEIGPFDAPDDTLDPNRRVMSQSLTRSSTDVAEYRLRLRPEDGDPSESSGPSP